MMTLAALLSSLAFGGMAFFSFLLAPLVFGKLGKAEGARFMRDAFAVFYPAMIVLTGLGALLAPPFWMGALLGLVAIGFLLAHLLLRPEIIRLSEARDAGDARAAASFSRLHGVSQGLNLAQFITLAFVVGGMVGP